MIFDKILYINMNKRKDRNLNIINLLTKYNLLDISERIEGIDGNKLKMNDTIVKQNITKTGINDVINNNGLYITLTKGGIGCALSHKKCYEYIIKNNINHCLILEDDIILPNDFIQRLKYLSNNYVSLDENYDMLFLGYHNAHINTKIDNYEFYFKPERIYGLFGYIVSLEGAKKLLNIFPLTLQIDSEISNNLNKLNAYCLNKNFCMIYSEPSSSVSQFGTDIQVYHNMVNMMDIYIIIIIVIIIAIIFFSSKIKIN